MPHDDSPSAGRSQQLIGFGIIALLAMTVVGSTVSGAGWMVGTIMLAVVCLTCFVMALRTSQRGSK